MKSLLKYLKDYKKETVLAPFFKMLEALFELFVPLVMAAIIDTGIAGNDKPYIFQMSGILIALGLIGLVCSITAQYFSAKAACGCAAKLKNALFEKMQAMTFTEMDHVGASTMINRMTTDVNQVQTGINMVLRLFLRSPFIVFGAMIMAFTVNAKAALVFVVVIPVLSVIVFGIMLVTIPLYKNVQGQLDNVLEKTRENLAGIRVIRAFGKEEEEIREFEARNNALTRFQQYVGKISALMNPVTYVVINIAIAVLIYVGAIQVNVGILTQGAVVALYNYMSQILVELIKLANLIITMTKSAASAQRIETIFKVSKGKKEIEILPEGNTEAKVVFDHVTLAYENAGENTLTDIDFIVNSGDTIGIIGGTGSGKTSLVHLIPGFYPVTQGAVYVDGKNVKSYEEGELRDKIAIVMQKAVLFKGTIRENMLWGNENATDEEIIQAIETAQGKDILEKKENGLDEEIEQGGRNLSGGQKQRLCIARALVRKPEILILDDSASALDYATDAALRKSLKNLSYHPTTFIVSQRTSSIMHADKIIVLDDGHMVGIGTHEELLQTSSVYKEIYDSQFKKESGKEAVS
ncbi:MAG: ABC transporter ATP-binding protein [Candidatus Gastranaerophilaceae bacterium]